MFKYYLFLSIHCFTQYYLLKKKYYELVFLILKFFIFVCAVGKKMVLSGSCGA
jgi:hypothetical protein